MKRRIARTVRAGFTLVEVLVTLVLIALLVAVVLPAVFGQLRTGENTRVMEDTESVRAAGKMFRIDVKRWPSAIEQLVLQPGDWSDSADINSATIPDGLIARWNGPYLETGGIRNEDDSLHSAAGAAILPGIVDSTFAGAQYWTIAVVNMDSSRVEYIDFEIDGVINLEDGRIQYSDTDSVMYYFASPIN